MPDDRDNIDLQENNAALQHEQALASELLDAYLVFLKQCMAEDINNSVEIADDVIGDLEALDSLESVRNFTLEWYRDRLKDLPASTEIEGQTVYFDDPKLAEDDPEFFDGRLREWFIRNGFEEIVKKNDAKDQPEYSDVSEADGSFDKAEDNELDDVIDDLFDRIRKAVEEKKLADEQAKANAVWLENAKKHYIEETGDNLYYQNNAESWYRDVIYDLRLAYMTEDLEPGRFDEKEVIAASYRDCPDDETVWNKYYKEYIGEPLADAYRAYIAENAKANGIELQENTLLSGLGGLRQFALEHFKADDQTVQLWFVASKTEKNLSPEKTETELAEEKKAEEVKAAAEEEKRRLAEKEELEFARNVYKQEHPDADMDTVKDDYALDWFRQETYIARTEFLRAQKTSPENIDMMMDLNIQDHPSDMEAYKLYHEKYVSVPRKNLETRVARAQAAAEQKKAEQAKRETEQAQREAEAKKELDFARSSYQAEHPDADMTKIDDKYALEWFKYEAYIARYAYVSRIPSSDSLDIDELMDMNIAENPSDVEAYKLYHEKYVTIPRRELEDGTVALREKLRFIKSVYIDEHSAEEVVDADRNGMTDDDYLDWFQNEVYRARNAYAESFATDKNSYDKFFDETITKHPDDVDAWKTYHEEYKSKLREESRKQQEEQKAEEERRRMAEKAEAEEEKRRMAEKAEAEQKEAEMAMKGPREDSSVPVQQNIHERVAEELEKARKKEYEKNRRPDDAEYAKALRELAKDLDSTKSIFSDDSDEFKAISGYLERVCSLDDLIGKRGERIVKVLDTVQIAAKAYKSHAKADPKSKTNWRRNTRLEIVDKLETLAKDYADKVPDPKEKYREAVKTRVKGYLTRVANSQPGNKISEDKINNIVDYSLKLSDKLKFMSTYQLDHVIKDQKSFTKLVNNAFTPEKLKTSPGQKTENVDLERR